LKEGDSDKFKVGDDITLDALEGVENVNIIAFSK
jgi:hypothetical protein